MLKPSGSIFGLGEQSGSLEDFTKKLCLVSSEEKANRTDRLIIGFNDFSMPFKWHWGGVTSIPQAGVAMGSERNVPLIQQTESLFYQLEISGLCEGKRGPTYMHYFKAHEKPLWGYKQCICLMLASFAWLKFTPNTPHKILQKFCAWERKKRL